MEGEHGGVGRRPALEERHERAEGAVWALGLPFAARRGLHFDRLARLFRAQPEKPLVRPPGGPVPSWLVLLALPRPRGAEKGDAHSCGWRFDVLEGPVAPQASTAVRPATPDVDACVDVLQGLVARQ